MESLRKLLTSLEKHQYGNIFAQPVDPILHGCPTYFDVIQHPMDLSKISRKLKSRMYENEVDFSEDIVLMINNCMTFNPSGFYHDAASHVARFFEFELSKFYPSLQVDWMSGLVLAAEKKRHRPEDEFRVKKRSKRSMTNIDEEILNLEQSLASIHEQIELMESAATSSQSKRRSVSLRQGSPLATSESLQSGELTSVEQSVEFQPPVPQDEPETYYTKQTARMPTSHVAHYSDPLPFKPTPKQREPVVYKDDYELELDDEEEEEEDYETESDEDQPKRKKRSSSANGKRKYTFIKRQPKSSKSMSPPSIPHTLPPPAPLQPRERVSSYAVEGQVSSPEDEDFSGQKAVPMEDRVCESCGEKSPPMWRRGPSGKSSLCNACGVKWKAGRPLTKPDGTPLEAYSEAVVKALPKPKKLKENKVKKITTPTDPSDPNSKKLRKPYGFAKRVAYDQKKHVAHVLSSNQLTPSHLSFIVSLIRDNMPTLRHAQDEIELDIETMDNKLVGKLFKYVTGTVGIMPDVTSAAAIAMGISHLTPHDVMHADVNEYPGVNLRGLPPKDSEVMLGGVGDNPAPVYTAHHVSDAMLEQVHALANGSSSEDEN